MSRTHVRRRRTVATLALVAVVLPVARAAAAGPAAKGEMREASQEYVVRPGDSLWQIAEDHAVASDPRDGVQMLLQRNPEASQLQPGMSLELPNS